MPFSANADPLPESELQALNEFPNWVASSNDCSAELTGPAGSGPLYGLEFPKVADVQDLANRINKFISDTQPNSPFAGLGAAFVAAGQKYNVNPAMMIGFAVKEQSLGTAQDFEDDNNHNSFGISGNNPGQQHQYPVVGTAVYYPSFQASLPEVADYIYAGYIAQGAPFYSTTLLQLMEHYTPNGPNQSSAQQTQVTLDVEHKILDGIATSSGVTQADSASADTAPATAGCISGVTPSSFTPGQNGYNLSGANAMAHFYQCDTVDGKGSAPWANTQYGQAGTVCAGGCGITSLAMVVDTLTGANETPGTLAQKYANYGGTDGTEWSLWPAAAKDYGLKYTDLGTSFDAVDNIIHQGGLVIVSVNVGYFTGGSHIMVIRAVDDQGNFYLADPNGPRPADHPTETKGFSQSFMLGQGNAFHLFGFTKGGS